MKQVETLPGFRNISFISAFFLFLWDEYQNKTRFGKKLDLYLHTNYSISASMSRFFSIKLTKWILIRVKHTEFGAPLPKVCDKLKATPSLFPLWVPFVRIDKDLTNDGSSISHLSPSVKFHTQYLTEVHHPLSEVLLPFSLPLHTPTVTVSATSIPQNSFALFSHPG